MLTTIKKAVDGGCIKAISSKSVAHRVLICAAFADSETKIICTDTSDDIDATAACLNQLGADITRCEDGFAVQPVKVLPDKCTIDCRESGSTLRFLLPLVCALGINTKILMAGRLKDRPLSPLWEELCRHGCELTKEDNAIYTSGRLKSGEYKIDASVSSQYITGLLIALSFCDEASTLVLEGKQESVPYIQMTLDVLNKFKTDKTLDGNKFYIESKRPISPQTYVVEGDWSNSAFWLCAGALLTDGMRVCGLDAKSVQGDRAIVEIIKRFGAEADIDGDEIFVRKRQMSGIVIDASDIPDLVPIVALVAAAADGKTVITGVRRLRLKESDRIQSVKALLTQIGADVFADDEKIIINGCEKLHGGIIDSFNDHRIAMTAAVASIVADGEITIKGSEAVKKSYPCFWEHFSALRGLAETKGE